MSDIRTIELSNPSAWGYLTTKIGLVVVDEAGRIGEPGRLWRVHGVTGKASPPRLTVDFETVNGDPVGVHAPMFPVMTYPPSGSITVKFSGRPLDEAVQN